MRTRREIESFAAAHGFRAEIVEKVARLVAILRRMSEQEALAGAWVLKGGTALNLFHLDLPRLSVDIDVNYIGHAGADAMRAARPSFERVLTGCCEREGCSVLREPHEHAGGKFRLRFPSAFTASSNLEVDVSYVARVPLLGVESRRLALPEVDEALAVPALTLHELAAGKFAALASRAAARDHYDAARLLEATPGLTRDPGFRLAFVCAAAGARKDYLRERHELPPLEPRDVEQRLLPLLRVRPGESPANASELALRLREQVGPAVREALAWTAGERRFLQGVLDDGALEPAHLTGDAALQQRVREQPMLRWKVQHVRRHRGLDATPN